MLPLGVLRFVSSSSCPVSIFNGIFGISVWKFIAEPAFLFREADNIVFGLHLFAVFFGGRPVAYWAMFPCLCIIRFDEDFSFVSFFLVLDSDGKVASPLGVLAADSDGAFSEK